MIKYCVSARTWKHSVHSVYTVDRRSVILTLLKYYAIFTFLYMSDVSAIFILLPKCILLLKK
jgi:hypothetical protein